MPERPPARQDNAALCAGRFEISYTTLLLLVLALTFLAYVNTTGFEFVYDDWIQITHNPQLDSWKNIPGFFMADIWGFAKNTSHGSYYRPVFMVWQLLNFKAFGVNPHWWHLTTLLLHLLATFLVYLLARRLLGSQPGALAAALFFGLTPLHIESVAWITDGIDTMMGVFFVSAFLLFLRAGVWRGNTSSRQTGPLIGSLFFYALALLVKETAVVLPGIVFAYEWAGMAPAEGAPRWLRRLKSSFVTCFPYLVVTAMYFAARKLALHGMASPQQHQPLGMILKTLPAVLWFDVRHLLWPFRSSEFYGVEFINSPGLMNFVLPAVAVVLVGTCLYFFARRSRLVHFAAWWMILPLLPALAGLALFDERDLVHDRQLYLSSIAFCLLLAAAVQQIRRKKLMLAVVALIASVLGISTAVQNRYWADDFSLYSRGVQVAPRNPLPRNYLAYVYVQRGDYTRGIELYQQALALDPASWRTNINLATTYFQTGQLAEAEKFFERAIAVYPKNASQRNASQYYYLGETRLRMKKIGDAEQPLRTAVEINPSGFGYHFALGYVLYEQGKLQEAREQFQADLAANPQSPARHQLALIDARLSVR